MTTDEAITEELNRLSKRQAGLQFEINVIDSQISMLTAIQNAAATANGKPKTTHQYKSKSDAIRDAISVLAETPGQFTAKMVLDEAHHLHPDVNAGDVSNLMSVMLKKKKLRIAKEGIKGQSVNIYELR